MLLMILVVCALIAVALLVMRRRDPSAQEVADNTRAGDEALWAELRQNGRRADATVTRLSRPEFEFTMPGTHGDNEVAMVTLEVEYADEAQQPQRATIDGFVDMVYLANFSRGSTIGIVYDAHDPSRAAIDRDRSPIEPDAH